MSAVIRYAWYGDDFTGASDTLATVADAGLSARLFLGVPTPRQLAAVGPLDALGIAGAARAMDHDAMREELAPVGLFFAGLGARLLHYKCCSTFDSAPHVGSLGVALEMLRSELPDAFVPVLGGQPSLGRYCAFGHLFASASRDGPVFRIDRHPTMSRHPVTPMRESDLRQHLAEQGLRQVPLVDMRGLDELDDPALDEIVTLAIAGKPDAVLFDVLRTAHLQRIGRLLCRQAARQRVLALGASSVAQALVLHWKALGELPLETQVRPVGPAAGPVFVLAGSQSPQTAQQVVHALSSEGGGSAYVGVTIDIDNIVRQPAAFDLVIDRCVRQLSEGRSVLARTTPARVDGHAPAMVAALCARMLVLVLEGAPHVRRVGVAGGDTSSLALRALAPWALAHAGVLSPGVSVVRACADECRLDGLELMLKGGQMGTTDIFLRLLNGRS
ncbi:four-carbon acid sugar kinase family protein [Azoarcus sp. L1K30]|uniref:four-carbon acid sugar kinase family protein n=1 Tax=Azoarcus sp. L1K30 TaxID=2820277 RepID=UPI001B824775|nr:four-carbon acid sugar kinase family protein [Azoarcus sp. L1K30]